MKKGILALLLLLLCYLLIGSIAPYTSQPTPTAQTQDSFQASDCYGEDTGSDRAAIIDDNQAALELRLQMISHAQEPAHPVHLRLPLRPGGHPTC